jgi:hypothetical protein
MDHRILTTGLRTENFYSIVGLSQGRKEMDGE